MHYAGAPWLIRESRQREEDCETMVGELHVRPGMTVCDMGCGNGFYALRLAELVGDQGRVLAVDIQPEMLRLLQARAAEVEVSNIDEILGTVVDPKLPPGAVDLIPMRRRLSRAIASGANAGRNAQSAEIRWTRRPRRISRRGRKRTDQTAAQDEQGSNPQRACAEWVQASSPIRWPTVATHDVLRSR